MMQDAEVISCTFLTCVLDLMDDITSSLEKQKEEFSSMDELLKADKKPSRKRASKEKKSD